MIESRECNNCHSLYKTRPQNPNQSFCSRAECQHARKAIWQKNKLKSDSDYRDNQRSIQRKWLDKNQDYWKKWRKRHPDYVKHNKKQQTLSESTK